MATGSGNFEVGVLSEEDPAGSLARTLGNSVQAGEYAPLSRLPSERVIAEQFGVGVRLVRKALALLEEQGVLERIERSGTFVRGPFQAGGGSDATSSLHCINFIEELWPVPIHMDFVGADHLAGYTEALERHDVKMRFVRCPEDGCRYDALLSPRFPFRAQGCIVVSGVQPSSALLRWLGEHEIAHVVQHFCAYSTEGLPGHHRVSINRNGAAFGAVQHLLDLGHLRIGFVGAVCAERHPVIMYRGYEAALVAAGLQSRLDDILDLSTDVSGAAEREALEFLDRADRPTAIVSQSDAMAMALLKGAHSLGINVPADLSIIGFNDQPEAALTNPPLTTFANPRQLVAKTAVDMLLAAAAGKYSSLQTRILNCELVVRGTTGPARV